MICLEKVQNLRCFREVRKRIMDKSVKENIYVCHTYYHVYISILKEYALEKSKQHKSTLLLSKMSTEFEDLIDRVAKANIFDEVMEFDEKRSDYFRELDFFNVNQGNVFKNMIARIKFTKLLAKLQEPYIPVNFREYNNIYVFCDSDPIGYYLNQNKIYYHAVEDGYNSLQYFSYVYFDNKGYFKIKVLMAKLNLIHIQDGMAKYCIDMEVNNVNEVLRPHKKLIGCSRADLVDRLTDEEKQVILEVFIKDKVKLDHVLSNSEVKKTALILTEPVCDDENRIRMIGDIVNMYDKEYCVIIKQHPKDMLDYSKVFPELIIADRTVPMEMFNLLEAKFDVVVAILTNTGSIKFAREIVILGHDFLDVYQDPTKAKFVYRDS